MSKELRKRIYLIYTALVTAVAFTMEYSILPLENTASKNAVVVFLYKMQKAMEGKAMLATIIGIAFLLAASWMYEYIKRESTVLIKVLSFVLAILMAVGLSMYQTNSFILLYKGKVQILKTIIIICGYYYFYLNISMMCYRGLTLKDHKAFQAGAGFFKQNGFRRSIGVLSVVWLPQIILKYPGAMCPDSYNQLYQYKGISRFTSHHPPFHTWVFGSFVQAGEWMGSRNVGLFLFILAQTMFFIVVLAYSLVLLEKMQVPYLYHTVLLVIYCTVPYYVGYAGVVIKDTLYASSVLLYFTCLVDFMMDSRDYLLKAKKVGVFIVSASFVALFRNNGIHLIFITMIFFLAYYMKVYWAEKRTLAKVAGVFLVPVILYAGINGGLKNYYDIQNGSKAEMLSIPFQQTARYIRDYGEEVTKEEREVIRKVLDYDNLGKLYNPRISDPVKATFNNSASSEELKDYFKVWGQQLAKHPVVYVEATMNSIYSLFCPNVNNYVYYANAEDAAKTGIDYAFSTPKGLKEVQMVLVKMYECIHELPVMGVLSNIAFYVIWLLYLMTFFIKDREYASLLLCVPGLLSVAIAVASPVILRHPRYMFPVVYTVPLLVCYYRFLYCRKNATE